MVRLEREQRSARGLRGNGRRIRIQPHHGAGQACVGQSQPIQQRLLRDQHARLRIPQHEGKARRRVLRIQRQIRPARLENAQQPHNELERALQAQPHNRLRTNPQAAQMLRKLVRPPIKLPVAQPPPLKHHRSRIRPPARLRRKQARQAPRQNLPPGSLPPPPGSPRAPPPQEIPAPRAQNPHPHPPPPAAAPGAPPAPPPSRAQTSPPRIRSPPQSHQAPHPPHAARSRSRTGRTSPAQPQPAQTAQQAQPPQSAPARCSETPASPGTADGAPATAQG